MAKGLLYVATRPVSAERAADYHAWYDKVHVPEVVALDGFVSARRLEPLDDDGPFVALYEIEGDDLKEIVRGLNRAIRNGELHMSDAMSMDPPPEMRLLRTTLEYPES